MTDTFADAGFSRASGAIFRSHREDTRIYVALFPDKYRTPGAVAMITVHLGITSDVLRQVFGGDDPPKTIGPDDVNWYRWAGYIDDETEPPGEWIVIQGDTHTLNSLRSALTEIILPAVEKRSTNSLLLDEWLSGPDVWLSPARQLAYVAALSRSLGRLDDADKSIAHLRAMIEPSAEDSEAARFLHALVLTGEA